jgi:ferredoxin-NADP reductase
MQLKLVETRPETSDVKSFFFEPEAPLAWKAGQYIHYKLPHSNPDDRGIERYFSIASAPFEKRVMLTARFAQKSSSFKRALNSMAIGATIEADPPEGDFILDRVDKPVVFIAGGIGITPFRAILLDLQRRKEPLKIRLLYANRTDELAFRDTLESLRQEHPDFRIDYLIGDNRLTGNSIREAAPALQSTRFFVSGPEPMVESLDRTLKGLGVPESSIVNDFFPGYDWP